MASTDRPFEEVSREMPQNDQAETLWHRAHNYVNQCDQMDWILAGLVSKPSLLEVFKYHVDGDMGGIGQSQGSNGADEALEVDAFEFRDSWHVTKSRSVGDLHRYLMQPTEVTHRVFLVNNPTSGVVGLLGAYFDLDPAFFSNHLSKIIPYHQRMPSIIAACNFMTFRYGRADIDDSWVIDSISILKQKESRCSNVFVLVKDHEIRERPSLTYKLFAPWGRSNELWTSVRAVIDQQIMYHPPESEKVYDPWFIVVETALTIAISELMFLLSAREKNTLLALNGLNRLQFAVTEADKAESETLTRETLRTSALGQATLPESYNTLIDCSEIALRQLENFRSSISSPHEQEKAELTSKDLNVLISYAKSVAEKHSLLNERTAQVFGPGGFPATDAKSSQPREDAPTITPEKSEK